MGKKSSTNIKEGKNNKKSGYYKMTNYEEKYCHKKKIPKMKLKIAEEFIHDKLFIVKS